jgi:dihydroorotate dehydrogenase (NAD+) catalytic subunit
MSMLDAPPAARALPVDMTTALAAARLPNPVLTASGCAAAGRELAAFFDPAELGAITTKSVKPEPWAGRPAPRMAETPSGMVNAIGLQGPGIDAFVEQDLAWLVEHGARAVVSIAGGTVDDYALLAKRLAGVDGVTAIEVNISCPNVESRGQVFACDPDAAARVIAAVRRESTVPVLAKLSPDVTDIVAIARACVDAGADGLSLINTLLGLVIDTDTMRPALGAASSGVGAGGPGTGGLSGPAIRPVALRCVWQVHAALPDVPILGMGGIMTGLDALQFILAGASAVSVGTAIFHDPHAPVRILAELREALAARGFRRLSDAVGHAHRVSGAQAGRVAAVRPPAPEPEPARGTVHRLLGDPFLPELDTGPIGPTSVAAAAAERAERAAAERADRAAVERADRAAVERAGRVGVGEVGAGEVGAGVGGEVVGGEPAAGVDR